MLGFRSIHDWEPEPESSVVAVASLPSVYRPTLNGWDGEEFDGGWGDDTLDDDIDYYTLRCRSHRLFEENIFARGVVRRLVTNVVHTGLAVEAAPIASMLGLTEEQVTQWTDDVETRFHLWGNNPRVCDYEERVGGTFQTLQRTAYREALVGGDVLVIERQHPQTNLPTIQLISGQRIATPVLASGEIAEGHEVHDGVEVDARGRHVAYYVLQNDGDYLRILANGAESGRRVAWLMYGTDRRMGKTRGTPLLSIVLQSLREIDRYRSSTQRKAVVNSLLSMWIEKSEAKAGSRAISQGAVRAGSVTTVDLDGGQRSYNVADQIPGLVLEELQHGEKPHAFQPNASDLSYPEFKDAIVQGIAWGLEIPPEILTLSFNANYSASAASLREFNMALTLLRLGVALEFCHPIYEDWLLSETLNGKVEAPGLVAAANDISQFDTWGAWTQAEWIGSVKPVTDLKKEAQAYEIMVAHGWVTNTRIARMMSGTKFSRNVETLKQEKALLDELQPETAEGGDESPDDGDNVDA